MSTQLYLVPLVQTTFPWRLDAEGNPLTALVPEYSVNEGDPLFGAAFVCMPLDGAGLALVASAPNDALAAESDVFAFPTDLTLTMSDDDITALSTVLSNAGVPTDFLASGITYELAAQTIGAVAQTLQQSVASGNPVQLAPSGNAKSIGSITSSGDDASASDLLASAAQWDAPLVLSTAGDDFAL